MSNPIPCSHTTSENHVNSKQLVICCDGTWNNSNDSDSPDTNVSRLAGAVARKCCSGKPQVVYYHPGAGTESSWMAKKLGGLLGLGVVQDIAETYRFICDNYNPGDEIVLIGFSRGAFTARSVADMICNIGFLNRAGLANLPDIFRDYATWEEWKDESTKRVQSSKHLAGFTIENYDRVRRLKMAWEKQESYNLLQPQSENTSKIPVQQALKFRESWNASKKMSKEEYAEDMAGVAHKELDKKKQKLYEDIKSAKTRSEISERYRQELAEHRLVVVQKKTVDGQTGGAKYVYEPVPGVVKAIGVWDTVGSLGVPKGPWNGYYTGRSQDEIRYASLEMHKNVRYAFHALALDEYRTAFGPTMWELGQNTSTILRQVWFSGNHGDVGGGWDNEQAANIALAWMADQLTSIGVEFSRPEMQRIFYDVDAGSLPENWAMGEIHNPPFSTAVLDKVYSGIHFKEPKPRIPGLYRQDIIEVKNTWTNVTEYITSWWKTTSPASLSRTEELIHPSVRIRYQCGGRGLDDERRYRCRALVENGYQLEKRSAIPNPRPDTVNREVIPYTTVGGTVIPFKDDRDLTISELKVTGHKVRIQQPCEKYDMLQLPEAHHGWVWRRPAGPKGEAEVVLEEEQVGMWERLYMKVEEELVDWQPLYAARRAQVAKSGEEQKWAATRAVQAAGSTIGNFITAGFGAATGWLTKTVEDSAFLPWGYHDIIVWQRGDLRNLG